MRRTLRVVRRVSFFSFRLLAGAAVLVALGAGAAAAEPLAPDEVPEPLTPWVEWVLRGHEAEQCSVSSTGSGRTRVERSCVWPTGLSLVLGEKRGTFEQRWKVERRVAVPLPGNARHWPQDVQVDGRAAAVGSLGNGPGILLEPGAHVVRGRFQWDALPELLQVPPQTALLAVTLETPEGRRVVDAPERDAQGRLWLRRRRDAGGDAESRLEVLVHRRLTDDVPMHLETRIDLEVSGRNRELALGRALPDGFVPMALESELPARIDADGRLRLQVRPGRFGLRLTARRDDPAALVEAQQPDGPWAPSEVWVFEARPDLRIVTVAAAGGASPVDPQQTKLPEEWKSLPAFLVKPGQGLALAEKRRGDADPAPDLLELSRKWWLDFDGNGYTVQDRIGGEIRRSSRLDMAARTSLGRVALNGRDQLITVRPDGDGEAFVGIEVPRGAVEIKADSRLEDPAVPLPAVGWDHDFQALSGELHLPPGWRLLHASGVDRARWTWVNSWNLLDLFMALVIALAFGRLWGVRWGLVAAAGMMLSYTEAGAPQWSWLAVLIGEALARSLPEGRFAAWISAYRGAALVALLLVGLPFAIDQARIGMHPSLEDLGGTAPIGGFARIGIQQDVAVEEVMATPGLVQSEVARKVLPRSAPVPARGRGSVLASSSYAYEPDPGARITTGPGLPAWAWRRVELSWNGPVTREQQLALTLSPPWLTGALAFLRVGLLAALAACVAVRGAPGPGWVPRRLLVARAAPLLLWLAVPGLLAAPAPARADFPAPEMLEELRGRLLAPPDCAPTCATAPRLRLEATPSRLTLSIEIDALAETGAPLPGGARSWLPARVRVDGRAAEGLRAEADGVLRVHLGPGRHTVELSGPLPPRDTVELSLPLKPHRVDATLDGWVLTGLLEDGRAERTLQLTRTERGASRAEEAPGEVETPELPPFVEVVRNIRLGLTWQVQTTVRRLTPIEPALRLDVPLLPGEAVTTAGIRIDDGRAKIALAPRTRQISWQSTLAIQPGLVLEAERQDQFREVWQLDVSPVWHVAFDGIPAVHQPSATAARVRQWRPWPGESVSLEISRPAGVEGATETIDASSLSFAPGLRASDTTLTLSLRSSRGGEHPIRLPEGAELQSVSVDGVTQPIRQEGNEVVLPLVPGSQQIQLAWREPVGTAWRTTSPAVDLGMPSVNASIEFQVPQSRWILWASGPRLGPAVLFWSYALVLAAIAFGLARVPLTPLRFHHWLLLGLGLTQVPVAAAATVVVWLLALGARRARGNQLPGRWFDLAQLGLVWLTLAALVALVFSIQTGLLGLPEMQIAGNDSSSHLLRWYRDRADASLPRASVFSVPLLAYRIAMLGWALWLAQALLRWLRWGWECFAHGELWRPLRVRRRAANAEGPEPAPKS